MSLFPFLFLFVLSTTIDAEQCDPSIKQPYNTSLYSAAAKNRLFALSNSSPAARSIRADEEYTESFNDLLSIFQDINQLLDNRKKRHDPRACNLDFFAVPWVNITTQSLASRQIIAENFQFECNAQFQVHEKVNDDTNQYRFLQRSKSVVIKGRSALFKSLSTIREIPDPTRPDLFWTEGPIEMKGWNLRREGQTCTLDRAAAMNVNNQIYITAEMTNFPVDLLVEDKKRQLISEFIKHDLSGSFQMIHPKYNTTVTDDGKFGCLRTTTDLLEKWSNKVALTATGNMNIDDNPALITALSRNSIGVDIASDSITESNTAILILPMVMSLIPVAFIADLNTWATFWYIVFTDIFSLIPFIIKGIELIIASRKSSDVIHVYRSGSSKVGQMEIWVASCQGDESFRTVGIIFLVLALLLLILGISLEAYANNYMRKQRISKGAKAEGPFGILLFQQHPQDIVEEKQILQYESKYDEEKHRRYSNEEPLYRNDTDRSSGFRDGKIQINEFR